MEVEAEEAVIANPGELQTEVEGNQQEAMDLREMTRSISSYHLQDIQCLLIIPSRV